MRTALITTTIFVPKVLKLYRAHDPNVRFFVAGDKKTPGDVRPFVNDTLGNAVYVMNGEYKCSELIGWNTIARRNIAMLEALKWGADIIVTIDDDNIPIDEMYFENFYTPFGCAFDGIQASSASGWFDVGTLLDPVAPHRGFPHVKKSDPVFSPTVGRQVGVAAGICLGDPDISATTRIAVGPTVHRVSELLRAGVVVGPAGKRRIELEEATTIGQMWHSTNRGTWTVFNSQNTAIIRELAPAFFMVPQWGRYDDIFASLVVQRLMRDRGYVICFGQPLVWQQRNQHDLLKDLRNEQFGAERILDFTTWLDGFSFSGKEIVTGQMRIMFTNLPDWMPERTRIQEMVLAWCEDCDEVMK